jgi:predicted Zn finger-like uncharacterized protein
MGAIIVQCPSCQARFHLAQERIPAKGARVRCSRCEHRFYVTSTGEVSESKPRKAKAEGESGPQAGASESSGSQGSSSGSQSAGSLDLSSSSGSSQPARKRPPSREAATTAMEAMREPAPPAPRIRSLGGAGPQEDADLDDPQFLFDDTQSAPELPYTPGNLGAEDEDPSSEAFGEVPGRARTARAPDTDVTPEEPPPQAPEPPPSASDPSSSGSWLSNDDEAIPDIRAQRDEMALQSSPAALASDLEESFDVTGSQTPERPVEPLSEPAVPSAPRADASRPAPRQVAAPEAPPGRYAGGGSTVLVARAVPERGSRAAAAEVPAGPFSISLERASALVSAFTALALLFAGWHVLHARLADPAGPERVRVESGEISSVEVLHLRDAEGRRVLAVRGLLQSASAQRPQVQLRLLDPVGNALGEPYPARPRFMRDADLASDRLRDLLAPDAAPSLTPSDARGFTVLVRDPPLEAERFALELAG